jgi:hypothetical protein
MVFLQQLRRQRLIALRQAAVTHHVHRHDGSKLAMYGFSHDETSRPFQSLAVLGEFLR